MLIVTMVNTGWSRKKGPVVGPILVVPPNIGVVSAGVDGDRKRSGRVRDDNGDDYFCC